MKLNADMGESFGQHQLGDDVALMPHIHMANIACGFHASDPVIMANTLALAKQHGVSVGAHPSYPDLVGFGRRSMACSHREVETMIWYQVGALSGIAAAQGCQVDYVKPHGALYNDMMRDPELLACVMAAVAALKTPMPLVIQATLYSDDHRAMAQRLGCSLLFEAFADRAILDDGTLVPRTTPNAVLQDRQQIIAQVQQLCDTGCLTAINGVQVPLRPDTLCVHGDNAAAIAVVAELRQVIDAL